jgi:hypothetical protein
LRLKLLHCRYQHIAEQKVSTEPQSTWRADFAHSLKARGALDDHEAEVVRPIVSEIIQSSEHFHCAFVNNGYDPKCINLFIVKTGAGEATRKVCGFAGDNTIFCETSTLESIKTMWTGPLNPAYQRAFISWVLAHEIGHAEAGDTFHHFERPDKPVSQIDAKTSQRIEFSADKRAAQLLRNEGPG